MNDDKVDYFEGDFTVMRRFMYGHKLAQPGEVVFICDRYLARELLELGRVTCDDATREKLKAACSSPPPGTQRNDVRLVANGGITRRAG